MERVEDASMLCKMDSTVFRHAVGGSFRGLPSPVGHQLSVTTIEQGNSVSDRCVVIVSSSCTCGERSG